MEEDDERKLSEASGHHPIEAFDAALQGVSSAGGDFKDEDFEQVSLGDQEKSANRHVKFPCCNCFW
ncbi:BnaC04g04290D [Brassica napus]|uniref:BnaC04g04290D protein n=1 Tax=Brassica napus TaxID=3708 RepID=A0A078G0V5_BRANA|nr:BnaC04g04290D [Brassica napus]